MPRVGSNQALLSAFSPSAVSPERTHLAMVVPLPPVALTLAEACLHAEEALRHLPPGARFTSAELLGGIELCGDKRGHGAVVKHLQRRGLITVCGVTTRGQEGRNGGYAAEWEVVK